MFAHRIIHGGHPTHICSVAPFFPPTVLVCSFPAIRPIRGQLTPTQSSLPVLWHCKQNLQGRLWAQQSSTAHNTAQNKSLVRRYAAFSKADTKACRFRSHRTVLTSQRQVPTSHHLSSKYDCVHNDKSKLICSRHRLSSPGCKRTALAPDNSSASSHTLTTCFISTASIDMSCR